MTCTDHRLALGGYVLGALEPDEALALERHVASCAACSAELDELAGVVGVLSSLSPAEAAAATPSPGLFDRIVAAADASGQSSVADASGRSPVVMPARRARPRHRLLLAAAAVVVLAGAGTAVGVSLSSSPAPRTTVSATSGGVRMSISASSARAGTMLDVRVAGLPENEHCRLVAVAADGSRHDAGTWNATYEGEAELTESTDVPLAQLRRLELYGTDGRALVHVDV